MAALTHVLETLLDELRAGKRALEGHAVDAMLSSVDVLRGMIDHAENGSGLDQPAIPGHEIGGTALTGPLKGQVVAVDQHLVGKLEQQGIAGALVGQGIVATLAQCIPEQQAALPAVDQVFPAVSRAGGTQATFVEGREQGRMALAEGIEHKLAVQLLQTAEVFEQIME